jgi:hypothetical protein
MFRPYTPELVGWFDGFSHPGTFDALGAVGRISTSFNQFTASGPDTPFVPDLGNPANPGDVFIQDDLDDKCPGAEERPLPPSLGDGGNVFDEGTSGCDPDDVLDQP